MEKCEAVGKCILCLCNEDAAKCDDCNSFLCSRHKEKHKPPGCAICLPIELSTDDVRGRTLTAIRDVQEGEIVLLDTAAVIVPDDEQVCLICYKVVIESVKAECPKCQLVMCNNCLQQQDDLLHSQFECRILTRLERDALKRIPHQFLYSSIGILRFILTWKTSQRVGVATDLDQLESHWDKREQDDNVVRGVLRLSAFLWHLLAPEELFDSQQSLAKSAFHAYGALSTNAIGIQSRRASAVYPLVAMASHSCRPNLESMPQIGENFGFRANRNICRGEEVTIPYLSTLKHRLKLRSLLKHQWFFECDCTRCLDPTDGGSFMSSACCPNCDDGWMIPKLPLDHDTDWLCNKECGGVMSKAEVLLREKEVKAEARLALSSPADLGRIAKAVGSIANHKVHPNHHQMVKLKHAFLDLWEKEVQDSDKIETAVTYCNDLLKFYTLIDDGKTTTKSHLKLLKKIALVKQKILKIRTKEFQLPGLSDQDLYTP